MQLNSDYGFHCGAASSLKALSSLLQLPLLSDSGRPHNRRHIRRHILFFFDSPFTITEQCIQSTLSKAEQPTNQPTNQPIMLRRVMIASLAFALTNSDMVLKKGDHVEVKIDGKWVPGKIVSPEKVEFACDSDTEYGVKIESKPKVEYFHHERVRFRKRWVDNVRRGVRGNDFY